MPKRRGKSVKRNKSWKVKLPNAVDPAQQRAILDTDKHALTLSPAKIRRTRAPEPGTTLNFVPGPLNLMPRFQNNDHNATDSENADLYSRNVIPTEHYDIDASVFQTSKRLQDVVGRYKQAQLETEAYEDALVLSSMRGSGQQATVQRGCDDARKEHEVTPEPVEDTEACALKEEARLAGFSTVSIYQKYLKLRDDLRRMTGPTMETPTEPKPEDGKMNNEGKCATYPGHPRPETQVRKPAITDQSWAEKHSYTFKKYWLAKE